MRGDRMGQKKNVLTKRRPAEKLDDMLAGNTQEVVLRSRPSDDFRAATVKQRPTSRRITQAEINVRFWRDADRNTHPKCSSHLNILFVLVVVV